ncbi:DUF6409 family protein [Streptomyces sp. H27-C3]|uniref:DUF6409 family protein n=1 Tax=Streptomyces sp. H27-C3 TaxID=3046305 RepID=UPI0024BBD2E7|nr:DUF6409 family protein [Streptomyces sp. H27-C3]MDJ0466133.1 DUF6409 family protein [Streptomyces sp. H27-C3]
MATTTDPTYTAGDIVQGRPREHGVPQPLRNGIVLRLFGTDPSTGYLVWWYGKGPASMKTVSLMFGRELTRSGVLEDLSLRVITGIARGVGHFDDARQVGYKAANLRLRKMVIRIQEVPTDWHIDHRCCLECGNDEPTVQLKAVTHTRTGQQALACDRHIEQVAAALG